MTGRGGFHAAMRLGSSADTGGRRGKNEIAPAQFVERKRAQEIRLMREPAFTFRDDGRAVTVATHAKWVAHSEPRPTHAALVGTPAWCLLRTLHMTLPSIGVAMGESSDGRVSTASVGEAG